MGLEAEEAHDRLKRRGRLPNRTQKQKRRKQFFSFPGLPGFREFKNSSPG